MIGTGTLTAYAGQLVEFSGSGSLSAMWSVPGGAAIIEGSGSLSAKASERGAATLSGSGSLTCSASTPVFGSVSLSGTCSIECSATTPPLVYHVWAAISLFDGQSTYSATAERVISFLGYAMVSGFIDRSKIIPRDLLSSIASAGIFSCSIDHFLYSVSQIDGNSYIAFQLNNYPAISEEDRTWVVNLDTGASSQYDHYGFISFFTDLNTNISYGLASDGIYELTGTTDAGNPINALIDFGRSDLGISQKKKVPCLYLGASSDSNMILKVDADEQVYYYEARSNSTEIKNHRVDIGKGLIGNYWNFTLLNQDGCNFDLETITFDPIKLSRTI